MKGWQVNDELERIWEEAVVANLKYCSGIWLEGLRKTTKYISQDSRFLNRDLNPGPPEHEKDFNHSTTTFCSLNDLKT
jgi:hypothetical protein